MDRELKFDAKMVDTELAKNMDRELKFDAKMVDTELAKNMDRELKFDAKMVDTELAKSYLKKHEAFLSLGCEEGCDSDNYVLDSYGNKIFCLKDCRIDVKELIPSVPSTKLRKQMCDLAKKIEENAELFSQLEFLIRKTPKDEVKFCDMKLIVQNLLHCSSRRMKNHCQASGIVIKENTPLAFLGFAAQKLSDYSKISIVACPETAVVCHLFTQLCHQVGLHQVQLHMVNNDQITTANWLSHDDDNIEEFQSAGLGIVTERSDADSAVNAFLESSTRLPWKLRRILIQESVYESVKKIFAWKCKNSTNDAALNAIDSTLKPLCTEIYVHEGKLYLFDYAAAGDCQQILNNKKQVVLVEAYRTTKELLSLLKIQKPYCISFWCRDISEANEISFGADAPVVWVNDFGVFDGPPTSSQSYYSIMEYFYNLGVHELKVQKKKIWTNLNIQGRIEKLNQCLEKYTIENDDEESNKIANIIEESILNWKSDSFVDVQKGRICVGTVVPGDLMFFGLDDLLSYDIIASMINGHGVLIKVNFYNDTQIMKVSEKKMKTFLDLLEKEGLPLWIVKTFDYYWSSWKSKYFRCPRTKVVWTNFGTIFAN